jgi:hypothetical protein
MLGSPLLSTILNVINYQVVSGNIDIDSAGDVVNVYGVWQVQANCSQVG